MSSQTGVPEQYTCDFCADSVSVRELSRGGPNTFYCDVCAVNIQCDLCGSVMTVGKHELNAPELRCEDCREQESADQFTVTAFIKRSTAFLGTLLALFLVRSLDVLLPRMIRVSDEIMHLRPFGPVIAMYESTGGDLVVGVVIIAVLVFLANEWLPIGLLDLVTFPGTIVHEWAHLKTCQYYGLQVYGVVYFQFDTYLGYVRHEVPEDVMKHLGVSCAPLIFNTAIAVGIAVVATVTFGFIGWIGYLVALWLTFSIGVGAIPSYVDADNVWTRVVGEWPQKPAVLLVIPVLLLIYAANALRIAFAEVLYGILLLIIGTSIGTMLI